MNNRRVAFFVLAIVAGVIAAVCSEWDFRHHLTATECAILWRTAHTARDSVNIIGTTTCGQALMLRGPEAPR